jgi:hypothetical protein
MYYTAYRTQSAVLPTLLSPNNSIFLITSLEDEHGVYYYSPRCDSKVIVPSVGVFVGVLKLQPIQSLEGSDWSALDVT